MPFTIYFPILHCRLYVLNIYFSHLHHQIDKHFGLRISKPFIIFHTHTHTLIRIYSSYTFIGGGGQVVVPHYYGICRHISKKDSSCVWQETHSAKLNYFWMVCSCLYVMWVFVDDITKENRPSREGITHRTGEAYKRWKL